LTSIDYLIIPEEVKRDIEGRYLLFFITRLDMLIQLGIFVPDLIEFSKQSWFDIRWVFGAAIQKPDHDIFPNSAIQKLVDSAIKGIGHVVADSSHIAGPDVNWPRGTATLQDSADQICVK
jgi:hypothetical protein